MRNRFRIFAAEGLEGLKRDCYQGGFSKLEASQLEELDAYVAQNVCLSCKTVRAWVKEKWGIEYSDSGMASLLHSLEFSYKKPSIMPGKAPSEAVVDESEVIDAQSTIRLCDKLQLRQMFGMIIVCADNARYYHCKAMKEYLAANPRVVFVHLPSYSPNLNIIERLRKFYKKIVLCQKYYATLDKMREASIEFFENLQNYASELKALLTLNFQIIKPKFSETGS